MGGGGLRILGHKKWHVWTRENIEKVRRDERLHEEKTKKETREKRQRDLDSRVEILKRQGKNGENQEDPPSTEAIPVPSELNHINFFKDAEEYHMKKLTESAVPKAMPEEGIALGGVLNPAYKHKRHKKSSSSSQPWYASAKEEGDEVDHKREAYADPMIDVLAHPTPFLPTKDKTKHIDFAGERVVSTRDESPESGKADKKKRKKEKKKKKEKDSLMDRLRAERRAREEAERARSRKLR
ncbi:hypothetical protein LEN26_019843 [Aphanomyces euteiches]|nr:hypothetical protein LEN26_019843 [Aphanomyces euteiches]